MITFSSPKLAERYARFDAIATARDRSQIPIAVRRFSDPLDSISSIAARLEPPLRRAFLQAVSGLGEAEAIRRLVAALVSGGTEAAIAALPFSVFEIELGNAVGQTLTDGVMAGGESAITKLKIPLRFDIRNPQVQAWIDQNAARLVSQVTNETQLALRSLLSRGYRDGLTPFQQGKQMRPIIGLTERQAIAVDNFRRGLVERGIKEPRLTEMAERYAAKQLRARASLIARQETMSAANAGLAEGWKQSQRAGYLPATARKRYIVARDERLCKICAPVAGQEKPIDEPFDTPKGPFDMPPIHVRCRCTAGIVR